MNWDKYFLDICNTVATNSKCFSRKIGAILVRDKSIISTGYNGPPRGIPQCDYRWGDDESLSFWEDKVKEKTALVCPRRAIGFKSGEGLDLCLAAHAETNAIVNAARLGISTNNTTMYMNCPISCKNCLVLIINSGITEIVVTSLDFYDGTSKYIKENSKLIIRLFHV